MRFRLSFLVLSAMTLSSLASAKAKVFLGNEVKVDPLGEGVLPIYAGDDSEYPEDVKLQIADAFCVDHDYEQADDFQTGTGYSSHPEVFVYLCKPVKSKRLKKASCKWSKEKLNGPKASSPVFKSITCIDQLSQDVEVEEHSSDEM